jgi:hypothetical protein
LLYSIEEKFMQVFGGEIRREETSNPSEEKKMGINSSSSYTYRTLSYGLEISECCEQGNELTGGFLF